MLDKLIEVFVTEAIALYYVLFGLGCFLFIMIMCDIPKYITNFLFNKEE